MTTTIGDSVSFSFLYRKEKEKRMATENRRSRTVADLGRSSGHCLLRPLTVDIPSRSGRGGGCRVSPGPSHVLLRLPVLRVRSEPGPPTSDLPLPPLYPRPRILSYKRRPSTFSIKYFVLLNSDPRSPLLHSLFRTSLHPPYSTPRNFRSVLLTCNYVFGTPR